MYPTISATQCEKNCGHCAIFVHFIFVCAFTLAYWLHHLIWLKSFRTFFTLNFTQLSNSLNIPSNVYHHLSSLFTVTVFNLLAHCVNTFYDNFLIVAVIFNPITRSLCSYMKAFRLMPNKLSSIVIIHSTVI